MLILLLLLPFLPALLIAHSVMVVQYVNVMKAVYNLSRIRPIRTNLVAVISDVVVVIVFFVAPSNVDRLL